MLTVVLALIMLGYLFALKSVGRLQVTRLAPPTAQEGEPVLIDFFVKSLSRSKRPLILLEDQLPDSMTAQSKTMSLPIAPIANGVVRSQYTFVPERRGKYTWDLVKVKAIDPMGISHASIQVAADQTTMLVLPKPIPFSYELPRASGFGAFEEGMTLVQSGIDSSGIRDYRAGDPLKHVHWRSTARTGRLQVKEFQGGSISCAAVIIQRNIVPGSEEIMPQKQVSHFSTQQSSPLFVEGHGSLDAMVGNVTFMYQDMARKGCLCFFPAREDRSAISSSPERSAEVLEYLAEICEIETEHIGDEIRDATVRNGNACAYYVFAKTLEESSVQALVEAAKSQVRIHLIWYGMVPRDPTRNPVKKFRLGEWQASKPGVGRLIISKMRGILAHTGRGAEAIAFENLQKNLAIIQNAGVQVSFISSGAVN